MKQSERPILWVIGALVLVLLVAPAFVGGMMGPGVGPSGMMGWYASGGSATSASGWLWGLGMGLGGLMMLAFWSALIAGIVLLVRWAGGTSRQDSPAQTTSEDPLTIVRRRYAAGEIDQATFERISAEFSPPPPATKPVAAAAAGGPGVTSETFAVGWPDTVPG